MNEAMSPIIEVEVCQRDGKSPRDLPETAGRAVAALLLITVLLALGCGAARPYKYYQLAFPEDPGPAKSNDVLPVTLLVGHLRASHLYREDRIVYGGKGEEMGTYEYERWAEPPTEMFEELLLRDLRASGRYQEVYSLTSESRGDYLVRGSLLDFKEISHGALFARVILDLEVRETKTGATVWTGNYAHDEPVSGRNVSAVVAALNRNAQRGVSEVCASLNQYFMSHAAK